MLLAPSVFSMGSCICRQKFMFGVWSILHFVFGGLGLIVCLVWCLVRLMSSDTSSSSSVSTFALSTVAFHQKFLQTEVVLFAVWSIPPPCAVREPPSTLQQQIQCNQCAKFFTLQMQYEDTHSLSSYNICISSQSHTSKRP